MFYKEILKSTFWSIILMALSGCVGFAIIGVDETNTSYNSEETKTKDFMLSANQWRNDQREIKSIQNREVVIYKNREWCGAIIAIVPLMLPVCDKSDTYYFQNNILVESVEKESSMNGVICSVFPVCDKDNDCKPCFTN